jgi:phosphoribosylanthranilate isomerase
VINGIQLKVCGLTRPEDARAAASMGADYLGFILYPKSKRYVSLDAYAAMSAELPDLPRVAVLVKPTVDELLTTRDLGFDHFQLHFDPAADRSLAESWAATQERDALWLAPHLPAGEGFPEWVLTLADTFHVDTFRKDAYGGTGETGDWAGFRSLRSSHPDRRWNLAGGLTPTNIAEAIRQSGAEAIDLSSGVEHAPGIKDPYKLEALRIALEGMEL